MNLDSILMVGKPLQILNMTEQDLKRVDVRVGLIGALRFMDGSPQGVRQLQQLHSQVGLVDHSGLFTLCWGTKTKKHSTSVENACNLVRYLELRLFIYVEETSTEIKIET